MSKELNNDIAQKFIEEMVEVMLKHYIDYSNGDSTEGLDDCVCQDNSRGKLSKYCNFIEVQDLTNYYAYVASIALEKLWSEETTFAEYLDELFESAERDKEEEKEEAKAKATYQFRSSLAMKSCEYLGTETSIIQGIIRGRPSFDAAQKKDKEAYEDSLKDLKEDEKKEYDTLDENDKILGAMGDSSLSYTFEEDFQQAGFCASSFEEIDNFIASKII